MRESCSADRKRERALWLRPTSMPVERIERELFHAGSRIFIVNAKESLLRNIERMLQWQRQHHMGCR